MTGIISRNTVDRSNCIYIVYIGINQYTGCDENMKMFTDYYTALTCIVSLTSRHYFEKTKGFWKKKYQTDSRTIQY